MCCIKKQKSLAPIKKQGFFCCPRRIRTTTNRTKNCCATITPYDNVAAKVIKFRFATKFFGLFRWGEGLILLAALYE